MLLVSSSKFASPTQSFRFSRAHVVFFKFWRMESSRRNRATKMLDPEGPFFQKWTKLILLSRVTVLCLDPLLFYIPFVDADKLCFSIDKKLAIIFCVLRSFIDVLYGFHIFLIFRTALIPPNSRLIVDDSRAIARRYLQSYFIIDIASIFPLPQVVAVIVIPAARSSVKIQLLVFLIIVQYFVRSMRLIPLAAGLTRILGGDTWTWGGAAMNFCLYMLASHFIGAFWYIASILRADGCWRAACSGHGSCNLDDLYCGGDHHGSNQFLISSCSPLDPSESVFDYGIYLKALRLQLRKDFISRFFHCFVWGLRNLSSLGQNLETSDNNIGESSFVVVISFFGLILFSILAGNIQRLLQCLTVRADEMAVKRREREQWMSRTMLPQDLRSRVRQHAQYLWVRTRGVDEESIINDLPKDLRRDIMRHQRWNLLCSVRILFPFHSFCSCIAHEGDPIDEMIFIEMGYILSSSRISGTKILKAGDFCGEELLTWAIDPNSSSSLPISTRTLKAGLYVDAFSLTRDDLRCVVSQFRYLEGEQFEHIFRFNSQHWRSWAACVIQSAWRRYHQRNMERSLKEAEDRVHEVVGKSSSFGAAIYASRFATKMRAHLRHIHTHLPTTASQKQS